jgi:dolichol-phosphate mannosyltransferase
MDNATGRLTLDVIIPLYNEAEVLDLLFAALDQTFSSRNLESRHVRRVRYLFVDDGSTDDSARIVAERIRGGAPAVLYRLSRNFGHASALSAGLDHATADLVAVLDADLQDPPAVVLTMIDKAREGYNVVFGQRRKRKESVFKRIGYWSFYRLIALLSDIRLPLDSGDFCLMDRRVLAALRTLPETLRYPRVLRAWVGFRQIGVEYERAQRQAGESKYTMGRLYRLATDGIASASTRPLKIAQFSSFVFGLVALALAMIFLLVLAGRVEVTVTHPLLLASLLIVSSNALIMLVLYVFSAYLGRMYLEVKNRPAYIIMEQIDPSGPPDSTP